jgi:DNA phosphorothioation-dependent restriction protein DptH
MSGKLFENFLIDLFINEFKKEIKPGYRYQFKSPDSKNGQKLQKAFLNCSNKSIKVKGCTLMSIKCGNSDLITVLHSEEGVGYSENFISFLRDEVAGQKGQFLGTSLLVIHNSMLDTLINSAENVAQQNGIWDPANIQLELNKLIDPSDPQSQVSECLLEHRFEQIVEDGATMFGFEELYNALLDGDLKFSELGLLDDPLLSNWSSSKSQIRNRLEKNKELYEKVDSITTHFPNDMVEKFESLNFGEKFVKKNFSANDTERWKTNLELEACFQEQKANLSNALEFEQAELNLGDLRCRDKAETASGKREKHLLLVLEPDQDEYELTLIFSGGVIRQNELILKHNKTDSIIISNPNHSGGKRVKMTVSEAFKGAPTFYSLELKRDKATERFKFRVLVIQKQQFLIDSFKHNYLIEPNKNRVTLQTEDNYFDIAESGETVELKEVGQSFSIENTKRIDFEVLANESDQLYFMVKNSDANLQFNVEGAVATEVLNLPLLLDKSRVNKVFDDSYFGEFNRNKNKVILDNKEVSPKGTRLSFLQWEDSLISEQILCSGYEDIETITAESISSDYPSLGQAYNKLFEYLVKRNTLISLAGWGREFLQLIESIIESYDAEISGISFDSLLTDPEKKLIHIGFIKKEEHEFISPFNPLVLAYYYELAQRIIADEGGSFRTLPAVTLSKLNPRGLLPFVYHPKYEFSYTQVDSDNCFWLELVPQVDTDYSYIKKLVKEKIEEFRDAFSALFSTGNNSTLIINSINNNRNEELFLGLVEYFRTQNESACKVHVNIYDDEISYTEFDRFSDTQSHEELKYNYRLDKGKSRRKADTVIDLLRTRITFSKFEHQESEEQKYSHLSFFKNSERVETTDVNIDEELSGVVSHGIFSGEAATNKYDSYFTSFGLKNVDLAGKWHLIIAQKLSRLIKPARKLNEQHSQSKSMALAVSNRFKELLDKSYQSSIWTTIIDPKVTLDFFESSKDVVLIHYSDNYTNSVNYDAITVTKQTEMYKKVLERDEGGIIEEFNAFNGEWLLKLITGNKNDIKEKRGIIGAYKFVTCLLAKSEITWVPLSVAEMIRVAGNIGLKMNDSDFSRNVQGYKKGCISDDVLFVGFKNQQMILLPLEVKAGVKQKHTKGVEQAKELKRYLEEDILGRDDLAGNMYRGLFIRQILMQIDKYKLYKLYEDNYFDPLLAQREWWLQGDYEIKELEDYPQGFLVSQVENDTFFEADFQIEKDILKIQLPVSFLPKFITTPLNEIVTDVRPEKLCHVPAEFILSPNCKLKKRSNNLVNIESVEEQSNVVDIHKTATTEDNKNGDGLAYDSVKQSQNTALPKVAYNEQSYDSSESLKVLVGNSIRDEEAVFWEPTNTAKYMNTNSGIIGTMGTGKTQCTKSVVTQLHRNQHLNVDGKSIGILIFDYKSDYVDDKFLNATNGKKFNLYKLPYNPLSLFGDTPMLPVHTARGFSETMGKAFGLGQKQQLKLRKLIGEAYELAGIHKADSSTWSKPAPTIADVWALFEESEPAEDSLYAALESLNELVVFETDVQKCKSLYELVDGITVIELAKYPSEIQNLVVALTLDVFYSQMQKQGKPEVRGDFRQVTKLILVDEADNFMSQNFPSLRKLLKEGREYGVGTILSTQDITHFKTSENDYSAYILSWIVHRVSQIKSQHIKSIFNKDDKTSQEQLMKSIRELEKHYSLYVDGDKKITKIKDRAFWELLRDS